MKPNEQILVCAPSNSVADLLAERMFNTLNLKNKFVRVYTETREDVFKMNLKTLK